MRMNNRHSFRDIIYSQLDLSGAIISFPDVEAEA